MPSDVITFGETMIRLSPPGFGRLESAASLDLRIGGSESNTACALCRLGQKVAWWSKLVDNPLGRLIAARIRASGVDTSLTIWSDTGRVGLYFIEFGTPPRPHSILYDRAGSAAGTLDPDEIDWAHLDGFRHLHVTGITAALSESCARTVQRAVKEARSRRLTVSLDVNYRAKLWPPDCACTTLARLIEHTDILICTQADAGGVFSIGGRPEEIALGFRASHGARTVIITAGAEGALALHGSDIYHAPAIQLTEVDRVGAGDAFSAGLLDGFLDDDIERGLQFGVAMAALKHTMSGDELVATRPEIMDVILGASIEIRR